MAAGEIITDFQPMGQPGKVITDFKPVAPGARSLEPGPFDIYPVIDEWRIGRSMEEDPPQQDFGRVISTAARPFKAQGLGTVAEFNRGMANLFSNLDLAAEFIESKTGFKKGGLFEGLAKTYESKASYWQRMAAEAEPNFFDELVSETIGQAVPGVLNFLLDLKSGLTLPAMRGARKAEKAGESEVAGAVLEAAKTGTLGIMLKSLQPVSKWLRGPAMGSVFGTQAAGETLEAGGEPKDIGKAFVKGFGSGLIYEAFTPGQTMGLNETRKQMVEIIKEREAEAQRKEPVIFEGKPVPPEVLREYPEIIKEVESRSGLARLAADQRTAEQRGSVQIGKLDMAAEFGEKPGKFTFIVPGAEERYQASVLPEPSLKDKLKEFTEDLWHKATRSYEHLPRTQEYAELQFHLKRLEKQKTVASYKANELIGGDILSPIKDPIAHDLFSRKVALQDLKYEAGRGHELPWGFSPNLLVYELSRIDAEVAKNPAVQKAIENRQRLWDETRETYAKAMQAIEFDPEGRFMNPDYWHHQVLIHADAPGLAGVGQKLKTPTERGFLKERTSSGLDINKDFVQAEYQVLAQMLHDIEIAKTIKWLRDSMDISDRIKREVAETGGKNWKTDIPEGYATWQPREGNMFFLADTIPAKIAEKIRDGSLKDLGLTEADITQVLAVGGKYREFCLPEDVVKTLQELKTPEQKVVIARAEQAMIKGWKIWQLISPRRFVKYETRNQTGDADATFVGNTLGFLKTPQAVKELGKVIFGKQPIAGELREFFERGGFESTLTAQELGGLQDLWVYTRLYENQGVKLHEIPYRVWKKYWKTVRMADTMRESTLRYANYLEYLDQMQRDPNGRPKNFGASKPEEIMGLADIRDRAYWLQNDLIGSYDRVSVMGQHLREYWFPFWSYKEINFKRYIQFARNAAADGKVTEMIGRKALSGIQHSPYIAYRVGSFLLKATAFASALQAWNYTMFPDEENDLPEKERARPHIVFGRDDEGNVISFDRIGALGDFLAWFGLDEAPKYVAAWFRGEMSLPEIAKDMAKSPVNEISQGITPQVKVPVEMILQREAWPDIFEPKAIRDRWFHLAKHFGIENEYRAIAGLPSKGYEKSLKTFLVYATDPGQGAYGEIQDAKRRWLEKEGKGAEGFWLTPKGNALYNIKLAMRYKDKDALEIFMLEYFNLGGTMKHMKESLKTMDPLSGLDKKDKRMFISTLSPNQQQRLSQAYEFYYKTLGADVIQEK